MALLIAGSVHKVKSDLLADLKANQPFLKDHQRNPIGTSIHVNGGDPVYRRPKPARTSCSAQLRVEDVGGLKRRSKNPDKSLLSFPSVDLGDTSSDERDPFAFQDYQFLFRCQREEVNPVPLEVVEGQLPVDLQGNYYLQGPGILSDDHGSRVSPLDGHGYVRKFSFKEGILEFSAKYVGTEACKQEFNEEKKSWKFTYRGPFSLLKKGARLGNMKVMKNVANTSVFEWAGKLMCLYEGGQPYEMDPTSLDTVGLLNMCRDTKNIDDLTAYLSSKVKRATEKVWDAELLVNTVKKAWMAMAATVLHHILRGMFSMPEERMLAHVKIDKKRQRLIAITFRPEDMLLPKSSLTVYEFDRCMNLLQKLRFTINDHIMIHDWNLTENHYVIIANRVKLNSFNELGAAMTGFAPMINAIALNDSLPYTPLYLLPRTPPSESSKPARNWRVPIRIPRQFWFIHASNAFEEKTSDDRTRILIDGSASSYQWFNFTRMFGYNSDKKKLDPSVMNDADATEPEIGKKAAMRLMRTTVTLPGATEDIDAEPECDFQNFKNCPWSCDFPSVNPALITVKHRYTYVAAASGTRKRLQHFPFDTVAKVSGPEAHDSVSTWWAGERSFVGEPVFVKRLNAPEPGEAGFVEDAGYLIVVQHSAMEELCYLVVLDAQLIGTEGALVARLRVPKAYTFPMGFHSAWEDSSRGDSSLRQCSRQ
ncbi:9-cis-beta-carotene 9',10'-cleaving dioxygenase [Marchantia polymorpha subsp. ruderalis]|uniref:Carotenoid cleavage dioxygenase 7 n=2 Tax=Marchantia polymorpha TaxID=3197 RepID=A0A176VJK0_MARPO|nr:hypothetical protein AXG93_3661s1550 [Marchantia polymorpha subsp. ruderalis]PTQ35001.1 hypothetical protein MARPO_0075s0089 [Marchantia polymorpha]BBN00944.1 hypothetical protein Mp_2g03280 [Marchantia polymorpha subsp. ruderalis]|eukprot:PTQ35001.1 hypothetical protein MARPO_0075s0089 [Marchantia polymorpha]